jgi:hypothetical protein
VSIEKIVTVDPTYSIFPLLVSAVCTQGSEPVADDAIAKGKGTIILWAVLVRRKVNEISIVDSKLLRIPILYIKCYFF